MSASVGTIGDFILIIVLLLVRNCTNTILYRRLRIHKEMMTLMIRQEEAAAKNGTPRNSNDRIRKDTPDATKRSTATQ